MRVNNLDQSPWLVESDVLIVGFFADEGLPEWLSDRLPDDNAVTQDLESELGGLTRLYTQGALVTPRLLLVGLGESSAYNAAALRIATACAVKAAATLSNHLAFALPEQTALSVVESAEIITEIARLALYDFTLVADRARLSIDQLTLLGGDGVAAGIARGDAIANGINSCRDLVNGPPNIVSAPHLAQTAREIAESSPHISVSVIGLEEAERMGMGAFASVGRGSVTPPQFIILEYRVKELADQPPIGVVGKGIIFDTGGVNLKVTDQMWLMKDDMGGGAAVLGLFRTLAELPEPIDQPIVGIVPATDNAIDAHATLPSTVVTALNGKKIEVVNTDAEGRLILADALTYIDRYQPRIVLDLATLTGSVVQSLGTDMCGYFATTDELAGRIEGASLRSGEMVWRLPLYEPYEKLISSRVADVRNTTGRWAGTIGAALFLRHFIGDYEWAHLDIAGTVWFGHEISLRMPVAPWINYGATGYGVRLLLELVQNGNAEQVTQSR
ncbi:MAG: leucyl aminopeptidase [Ardenticatenales bacterium]|nr:leucyl aminopeptidase [Ardenticatenales bacterium]MCB9172171.1 leucyl aminopeptidase [Ardenticatenales bacterium]